MKWKAICGKLGLDGKASHTEVRAAYRSQMAAARRAGNDERAIELSKLNQCIKRHMKPKCVDCGMPISRGLKGSKGRCSMHANVRRFYGSRLNERGNRVRSGSVMPRPAVFMDTAVA